jgi:hypothetical protein
MSDNDLRKAIERFASDPTGFFLRLAHNGNKQAANDLMERFIRAVDAGDEIDQRLLLFIADKLRRVVDGEDSRSVFPKPGEMGRPAKDEEHLELAVAVAQRMLDEPVADESLDNFNLANWTRKSTESDAVAEVAEASGVTESKVKKAFQHWRPTAYWRAAYLKKRRRL